jgi:uncharacterized membrane protein
MKIKDYLSTLYAYTFEWLEKKLVSVIEREEIEEYIRERQHQIKPDRKAVSKRIMYLLYTMGVILILAGAVYFIASNWGGLHKFVKLAIILIGMAIFYIAGFITQKRYPSLPLLNKLLTFSGTFFFGIALSLVGQIYNIHANSALIFFIWLIPSIVCGFLLDFEPYYSLSALLVNLSVWFYFFPANSFWEMIMYNWQKGIIALIIVNCIIFLTRSLNKKAQKGMSFVYIPYVLLHLYWHFISFRFVSDNAVFFINGIYILFIVGCFFYIFRFYQNRFLSYYTLVMVIVYVVTKYFEIIIYFAIEHGLTNEFFMIMIFCGLAVIPLSIFLVRLLMKYISQSSIKI